MTEDHTRISDNRPEPPGTLRRLQVFSIDPSAETRMDLALVSRTVVQVRWEELEPGPVGEYLAVIDHDPASLCFYEPVDLDRHLASDGLAPSAGDPRFHQQMVYAIAMKTISIFEEVLGRSVIWSERVKDDQGEDLKTTEERYVQRLWLFPHAFRNDNAYYSPQRKAILFGYYTSDQGDYNETLPGGMFFTCLSHDIIVHEVTHAILDSIHPKLLHTSNHDMLAFHEAFADLVAIFQHFTLPDLLNREIALTRGNLRNDNLLASLAIEFARSTGRGQMLRNALGSWENGERKRPQIPELHTVFEPHDRGGILVAAVFDAFLLIYEENVRDLRRIATNGTGILPDGDIHPDLVNRFAAEAVKLAGRMLKICIRAIDYIPPVDVTFGDYLRALITADRDIVPNDKKRYRVAFLESFREKGIYPHDVRTLSEESLRWRSMAEINDAQQWKHLREFFPPPKVLRSMVLQHQVTQNNIEDIDSFVPDPNKNCSDNLNELARLYLNQLWTCENHTEHAGYTREDEYRFSRFNAVFIHRWLSTLFETGDDNIRETLRLQLGIDIDLKHDKDNKAKFQVLSVRKLVRPIPDGISKVELFVSVSRRQLIELEDEKNQPIRYVPEGIAGQDSDEPLRFFFRSGCTLIVDPDIGRIRYAIRKTLYEHVERSVPNNRISRCQEFFRSQYAKHGENAVVLFGLTPAGSDLRRHIDTFSIIHDHQSPPETY